MNTCYGGGVTDRKRRQYRAPTDAEAAAVLAAEERRNRAIKEGDDSLSDRYDLWRELYAKGVSPTRIAELIDHHRTDVQKIVTPGQYRARRP